MNNMDKMIIPNGWDWVTLGSLCELIGGGTPSRANNSYFGNDIVWVTPTDIPSTTLIPDLSDSKTKLTEEGLRHSSARLLPIGTVLFSSRATIGKIGIAQVALSTNQGFANFVCSAKIYNRYLAWALRFFTEDIKKLATSAVYLEVNKGRLRDFAIPIPFPNDPSRSLETQKRIVLRLETLLGEVKSARELQESIEEDTSQLLDAFLGETFSESNNWSVLPISKFADVKGGKRLPKGEKFAEGVTGYPYLRVVDFKDFSIEKESLKYLTPEIQQTIRRYTISKEDVYISIAGTIGLVGTIPPELDGSNLTENAAKIVFRPDYKDKIDPMFIAYYLASPSGKEQIKKYTMAAGQPKLALIRIQTIEVPLPDINIQKSIVNRISTVREEISEMQRAQNENSDLLTQTEQSLLAQAFRGEL